MRGITLLELLIVIAVMILVSFLISGVFSSFRATNVLIEADSGVIGLLRDARSRTLAGELNSNFGVHFENTKAVLFKGDIYNASAPENEPYILPGMIEINNINLTGGATEVIFTRLFGTTTASGTVSLRSRSNTSKTRTVSIFSTGGIQ